MMIHWPDMETPSPDNSGLIADVKELLEQARNKAYAAVNTAMVEAYWHIGRRIVAEEQHGHVVGWPRHRASSNTGRYHLDASNT